MPVARSAEPRGRITTITEPQRRFTRQKATGRVVMSLAAFLQAQAQLNRRWLAQHIRGRKLAGLTPGQLQQLRFALDAEGQREIAFARRSADRVSGLLPKALERPIYSRQDRQARFEAVNTILDRELGFAQQRAQAMALRTLTAVRNLRVQAESPRGAYWKLGNARQHTPACVAMAGRVHPWSVLSMVRPPVHTGCVCQLHGIERALANGWTNGDVPGDVEAIEYARHAMALEEGQAERLLAEVEVREWLVEHGADADRLAELAWGGVLLEAFSFDEEKHPRGRGGRWIAKAAKLAGDERPGGQGSSGGGAARGSGGGRHRVVRFSAVDAGSEAGYAKYVAAVRANPRAEFVAVPSREELADKRAFLSDDGKVGVTVSGSGEVGNLFRNPGAPAGAGGQALDHAVANGGAWLECFDGALPGIYRKHGFVELARLRWDPAQAPSGWDSARHGTPDVVFMGHGVPERAGRYFVSWDEAEAATREAVRPAKPRVLTWREPPRPTGAAGERKGGGLTAVGVTNTKLGDQVEHALTALGFEDAHPGRRQGPFDVKYDGSVYEVKAVSSSATEYKAKPKKAEVERKLAHARENGLNAHVMIVVYDPAEKRIHAYVKEGVGAYRLTGPKQGWSYIGGVALDLGDSHDPVAERR